MIKLITLETRLLVRERIALALLALAIAACGLAFVNGRAVINQQIDGRVVSAAEDAKVTGEFAEKLKKNEPAEERVLYPYRVRFGILAPMPPLVDFSAGRAAFENYSTQVTLRARVDTLFKRTQLDNPEMLMRGSFDLGFVAIVLAPLLLIGLGYGLFVADRDSGAARLVLAQGGSPVRLLIARSIPRLVLVFTPLLLTATVLLAFGPDIPRRLHAAGAWLVICTLLLLFWWAVVLFINSLRISAETAALALISLWALLTLVLPALIAATAQTVYPPPSRFDQIATARAAEVASTRAYENDHPDLAAEDAAGRLASIRKTWEIGKTVDAVVAPATLAFEAQLARQQRLVAMLSWFSPPLIAGNALNDSAGTGERAWLGFRTASRTYLGQFRTALGSLVESGTPLDQKRFAALPRFDWQWPAPMISGALVFLIILTGGLGIAAIRRFQCVRLD
jgi:ABC-2 type transport system permease protein